MTNDDHLYRLRDLARRAESAMVKFGPNEVLALICKTLSWGSVASRNAGVEEALIEHGLPFTREFPTKVRRGRMKRCFNNAYNAAERGEGSYVEGFAVVSDMLVHHAWITRDGSGAVEVTWGKKVSAS